MNRISNYGISRFSYFENDYRKNEVSSNMAGTIRAASSDIASISVEAKRLSIEEKTRTMLERRGIHVDENIIDRIASDFAFVVCN